MKKSRIVVGLSGGVDSAVAVALLKEKGYEVTGVFLECYSGLGCRASEDRKDALAVALKLKIPFKVLDFKKEYKQKVLDYFYTEYKAGRTPNPDVMCNREIKFGLFYEWARRLNFEFVATGHYARIGKRKVGSKKLGVRYELMRSVDRKKDQSYFLYQLKEEQLKHILFPIGEMTKEEVRTEAKRQKLPVADKPDSQGICFVGEVDIRKFLRERIRPKKGEVVIRRDIRGTKSTRGTKGEEYQLVGEHEGVWFYTIGQRIGLVIKQLSNQVIEQREYIKNLKKAGFNPSRLPPLYVIDKDIKNNRLVVGRRSECMKKEFEVRGVHFVNKDLRFKIQELRKLFVRIRHQGALIKAKLEIRKSKLIIQLAKPAFGVAAGQAAVFYDNDVCLGGGVIINQNLETKNQNN